MSLVLRNSLFPKFPSLLNDFFDDDMIKERSTWTQNVPAANVFEDEKEYLISLAVPGLERSDFNLNVENGYLTISAEKHEESEEIEENFTRKEFSFDSFRRSFYLPENTNEEKIDAVYKDGLLKVVLPKMEVKPLKQTKAIKVH